MDRPIEADAHHTRVSFESVDFFEHRRLPYLVAINCFDGMQYRRDIGRKGLPTT